MQRPNALQLTLGETFPPTPAAGITVRVQPVPSDESDVSDSASERSFRARFPTPPFAVPRSPAPPAPAPPMTRYGLPVSPGTALSLRQSERTLLRWIAHGEQPPMVERKLHRLYRSARGLPLLRYHDADHLHGSMFEITLELDRLVNMARQAVLQRSNGFQPTGGLDLYGQLDALNARFNRDSSCLSSALPVFEAAMTCSTLMAQTLAHELEASDLWAMDPRDTDAPLAWTGLYRATLALFLSYKRVLRDLQVWRHSLEQHQLHLLDALPQERVPQTICSTLGDIQPLTLTTLAEVQCVRDNHAQLRSAGAALDEQAQTTIARLEHGLEEVARLWQSRIQAPIQLF